MSFTTIPIHPDDAVRFHQLWCLARSMDLVHERPHSPFDELFSVLALVDRGSTEDPDWQLFIHRLTRFDPLLAADICLADSLFGDPDGLAAAPPRVRRLAGYVQSSNGQTDNLEPASEKR